MHMYMCMCMYIHVMSHVHAHVHAHVRSRRCSGQWALTLGLGGALVRASACAHARRARWPLTLSHIWTMWRSLSSLQPPGLFYLSIFDFVIDEELYAFL